MDDLGIANNTIVIYTTDNGPHQNSWPDAGTTPFRSEKNTNWEGAFRVPCMIRWPGGFNPARSRTRSSAGSTGCRRWWRRPATRTIKEKLLKGYQAGSKTFKVHLDGYNQLPYLTGQQERGARKEFIYFNDDGDLVALRYENWKVVFEEQRAHGHAANLGRAVHQAARARKCSICARTPTSARTSPRTPTTTGSCRMERVCSSRRQPSWASSWRRSRSIRRASGRRASASIRSSRRCRKALEAAQ